MSTQRPKTFFRGVLIASLVNTLVCILFTFWLLNRPTWNGAEMSLFQYTTLFKTFVLGIDQKPPKKDFLFVDVSRDKQLVDLLDNDGIPVGNLAITDRERLTELLNIFAQKPANQQMVLCDLMFDQKSPSDSALEAAMNKLPNLLLSYVFDGDKDSLKLPPFKKIKKGLANYETYNNTFLKFKLFYKDTLPTVPVKMYEMLHQKKPHLGWAFNSLNHRIMLNHFVPNLRIRNYDLFDIDPKKRYNWIGLGELLMFPEDVHKICKDRIIVIGSFQSEDKHNTIYGDMAGPLILVNTYLALKNGDNVITIGWVIWLCVGFLGLSFFLFWQIDFSKRKIQRLANRGQLKYVLRFLTYSLGLSLLSIISFFGFGIHLNILWLSFWFYLLDSLLKTAYRKRGWLSKPENVF
ncbi:hypothetical protein BKI52_09085 [marine bacterium AO1-C]|nr:hypothetical protein BKI52_09085 [marine bacterium AO1-C]